MVEGRIQRDHRDYWEIENSTHVQGIVEDPAKDGFNCTFCCRVVDCAQGELYGLSWGICQVWGFSSKMDLVLECECSNSAEVTWEKCLNTDYFQRFMNSVLQWVDPWFCNCLADNTVPDVFIITTQAEGPDKSWLYKDLATSISFPA